MGDDRGQDYVGAPPKVERRPEAQGDIRVALVIGNGAYRHGGKLVNPHRDAKAIAGALTALGFDRVDIHTDLELRTLGRALTDFRLIADTADTAVVYFAGHGIEVDGLNRLIPVDAELDHVVRVSDETVPLNRVQQAVQGARNLRVVILDACRDNPFIQRMRGLSRDRDAGTWSRLQLEQDPTRSIGQGLAAPRGISNMLVAYAADAGQKAKDGPADGNSPFASAFVEALTADPYVDVRFLFGRVRDGVVLRTGGSQEPAIYGQLGGGRYALCPVPSAAAVNETAAPSAQPASDLAIWQAEWSQISSCEDPMELEHFASHAPPYFAGKARTRIAQIEAEVRRAAAGVRDRAETQDSAEAQDEARQRKRTDGPSLAENTRKETLTAQITNRVPEGSLPNVDQRAKPNKVGGWQQWLTNVTSLRKNSPYNATTPVASASSAKGQSREVRSPLPEFVRVQSGHFVMGSTEQEWITLERRPRKSRINQLKSTERPIHKVEIDYMFEMSVDPVTVEDWSRYCAANGNPSQNQSESLLEPITNISWDDVQRYLRWLNETHEGEFRLPSEAEWEYCCRAGTATAYFFGNTMMRSDANFDARNYFTADHSLRLKREEDLYTGRPLEVYVFPKNAFGLRGMHGNVWEWTNDDWHATYARAPTDGSAWRSADSNNEKVIRGGSFRSLSHHARSASRYKAPRGSGRADVGFRIVREIN